MPRLSHGRRHPLNERNYAEERKTLSENYKSELNAYRDIALAIERDESYSEEDKQAAANRLAILADSSEREYLDSLAAIDAAERDGEVESESYFASNDYDY